MVKFGEREYENYLDAACGLRDDLKKEREARKLDIELLKRHQALHRHLLRQLGEDRMAELYQSSPLYIEDLKTENRALSGLVQELQKEIDRLQRPSQAPAPKSELDEIQPDHAVPHPEEPSNILHFTAYLSPSG